MAWRAVSAPQRGQLSQMRAWRIQALRTQRQSAPAVERCGVAYERSCFLWIFCHSASSGCDAQHQRTSPRIGAGVVSWARLILRRMKMRHFLASVAVSFTLVISVVAQSSAGSEAGRPGVNTAFARAQHLRHGINASGWFSQSRDYSAFHTDRYTDADDIALIAKLGFDNVRLSIDGEELEQAFRSAEWGGKGVSSDFVVRLDKAVDTILADGLAVQIDVHPAEQFNQQLRSGDNSVERFVELWRELAAHYSNRDPERVFFE